jgi:hypothetical protein
MLARGKNGTGKTSLVEAILWGMTGEAKDPVRAGSDEAKVEIDWGDFVAKRTKQANGKATITVRRTDGKPLEDGSAGFLKKVVGPGIGLAPMNLFKLRDDDQVISILRALNVDIAEEMRVEKGTYDLRTGYTRDLKQKQAERAALVEQRAHDKTEPRLDGAALVEESKALRAKVEAQRHRNDRIDRVERELKRAFEELAAAEKRVKDQQAALAEAQAVPSDMESVVKLAKVDADLASITARNAAADRHSNYLLATKQVAHLEGAVENCTKQIDEAKAQRAKKIAAAAANVGLPKLSISDDCANLTYGGIRLNELSTGEKILFVARLIAGTRPELRILVIDEASSVDEDGLAELFALGHDLDLQLVLAQVGKTSTMEVTISDGEDEVFGSQS